MVNEISILKDILEDIGLEELLLSNGLDPIDALLILYETGNFDLERLIESYENSSEEEGRW